MARKERHDKLEALLIRMPLDNMFYSEQAFIPWQGEVSALLSYNPKLQSDFQGAVNAVETPEPFGIATLDTVAKLQRPNAVMRRILAQAISELELPEELVKQTAPTEIHLTDEHGIFWFISHCTWGSRFTLIGLAVPVLATVFFAGFRLGAIESVRNLYIQWENSLKSQPSPRPTAAQPNK
jgi:hypothetical protein